MSRAIGMIECRTVSAGVLATDTMVKSSNVELIEAETVCPGKYIALIAGDLSAVTAAVENGRRISGDSFIDSFILGNPHESIFSAIYGTSKVEKIHALGILETYDSAALIEAADIAVKTAIVDLIEIRIAKGMCGKSFFYITGEIAAVDAAVARAKEFVGSKGMYLDSAVIAQPDEQVCKSIL